ncbi:hypothetical protein [Agrococcus sp. Ld7]|uniref:hypothetical protein n=1 Tax=Agrococcus sp. Ld7 TaxID=649148 RepID=UPI00386E2047
MVARRARLGSTNALAWVASGAAATALATDALTGDVGPLALALGTVGALAGAALGLLAPATIAMRTRLLIAGSLALLACIAAGALALLQQPPQLAVAVALGIAAGVHTSAVRAGAAVDVSLAPRVRPAPALLAAAVGAGLTAAAGLLPSHATGTALLVAAGLQLVVLALIAAAPGAEPGSASVADDRRAVGEHVRPRSLSGADTAQLAAGRRAPIAPPALLALLAVAAAAAGAIAALRPGLSAIGATDPVPAGPIAITLAIGALLGPPLSVLASRVGAPAASLAVVGGGAALIAPVARPGVLDAIAAVILGVALATVVALAELARRAGQRLATGASALVVLAGGAGAALAGLLLAAVPLPDVVLGAALACLVAGVSMWAPGIGARRIAG